MRLLFGSSLLAIAMVSTGAAAQESVESSSDETIVVTGSRLGRTAFNAPTPVNVVGAERLEETGQFNVGDALNQLPSFRQITSPATNLYRSSTSTAARTMDLRGLGDSRTLLLVDGRRFVPSSELGTVDLNAIPSSLVQRAEVVTGGASAAYGANAVAGVVNLILDTDYTGMKASAAYGETDKGDAKTYELTGAYGTSFAGGRGHLMIGAEFLDEKTAGDPFSRDWYADTQLVINPNYDSVNMVSLDGRPRTLLIDHVVQIHNEGGVIGTGPLEGTQFDPDTGLPTTPFQFGDIRSGIVMTANDPSDPISFLTQGVPLRAANRHFSGLAHTDYEVSDSLEIFGEFSFSYARGGPTRGSDAFAFNQTINIDNPYIPDSTLQDAIDAGLTSFPISKLFREIGHVANISVSKTYRGVVGARGDLTDVWSWDAYYQYGQTTSRLDTYNILNRPSLALAVDAVVGTDGVIMCRSTVTDPTNGCVPFNVFGANRGSAAAVDFVTDDVWATRKITQHVAAANVRGTLAEGWAGPIDAAFGVEGRSDRSEGDADPLSLSGTIAGRTDLPRGGDDTVEGYAEVSVPLLPDLATLDGAIRQTHTRDTGNSTTWKLGLVVNPSPDIMVRITRSHDIRAPSELELSSSQSRVILPIDDGDNGTIYVDLYSGGNPDLDNEVANTSTAGVVLTPGFFPGFRLSVDYYDIKVKKATNILTGQQTVNICNADPNSSACGSVNRDGNGTLVSVLSSYQNLGQLHAEGIEIVGDYTMPLGAGSLNFSTNVTYTIDLSTTDAFGLVTNYEGWTGNPGTIQSVFGVPKWRGDALVTYSDDRISLAGHARYVGKGVYDPTKIGPKQQGYSPDLFNSINYNSVSSRLYLDLTGGFDILSDPDRTLEVFGTVTNLLDKDPPRQRLYGNPVMFDGLGRRYRVGVRAEF